MNQAIATLPTADLAEYCDLPEAVRKEARELHERFQAVVKPIKRALEKLANETGIAFNTLYPKFYAWKRAGCDWRSLINRAKAPETNNGVSKEFLDWYVGIASKNQRKTRPAFREFARMWRQGQHVPGLDNSLPRHELPAGCTYANLQKHLKKHQFALTAMRRGLGVARAECAPQMFTSRKELWAGSHFFIDDVWHDNFVIFRGQIVRVLELGVLDGFSASRFAWGCKPRQMRAGGTMDNLKERFSRLMVASVLWNQGYAPRGTTWVAEHGTAAISDHVVGVMERWSKGSDGQPRVTVDTSGFTGEQQAILGIGKGQGKGNPRFKSPLEALHGLIHNELGALPAQTGKDVEHRPEFTHGQLTDDANLLKAAQWLAKTRPDRVGMLKLGMLQYHSQFLPLLSAVYEAMNRRGEDPEIWSHELEGWHEAGLVHAEFRLSPDSSDWMSSEKLTRLPAPVRDAFRALATTERGFTRERRLSPDEVFRPGVAQFVKFPGVAIAEMLGDDYAREESCEGGYFQFKDDELAPESLRYESRVTTAEGREEELQPGKYKLFINPFAIETVFVHDARGRYLGAARRDQRVSRADVEAIERQFGRTSKRLNDLLLPIKQRHAADTRAATIRMQENIDVLSERHVTAEEKAEARRVRQCKVTAEDLVAASAAQPAAAEEAASDNQQKLAAFRLLMTKPDPNESQP